MPDETLAGVLSALGCFTFWGLFPIYFKLLHHVPAMEALARRVLGSTAPPLAPVLARRQGPVLLASLRNGRHLRLPTVVGLIQHLTPTLQCLLAVAVYHEPFTRIRLMAFGRIWLALALHGIDAYSRHRPHGLWLARRPTTPCQQAPRS
ncbi:MAG: hypothetical protein P9E24_05150 [Candidatus Competibacter sp.]|nr:hypothetical protein [Candidatus Competibacter sp.]MDG4584286.1 hypothetical protein [Candidatus Competibacter sp.]